MAIPKEEIGPPIDKVLEQVGVGFRGMFPICDRRLFWVDDVTDFPAMGVALYKMRVIEDKGGQLFAGIVTLYSPWRDIIVKPSEITKDQFDMMWNVCQQHE